VLRNPAHEVLPKRAFSQARSLAVSKEQAVVARTLAERACDEFQVKQLFIQKAMSALPRGTVGAELLEEVASACSSCHVKRRATTIAAVGRTRDRYGMTGPVPEPKPSASGGPSTGSVGEQTAEERLEMLIQQHYTAAGAQVSKRRNVRKPAVDEEPGASGPSGELPAISAGEEETDRRDQRGLREPHVLSAQNYALDEVIEFIVEADALGAQIELDKEESEHARIGGDAEVDASSPEVKVIVLTLPPMGSLGWRAPHQTWRPPPL
jgi:hypothetical protein